MSARRGPRWVVLLATLALSQGLVASPVAADDLDDGSGGPNNVVQVVTRSEGDFKARARVKATPFAGDAVSSTNLAVAHARDCTGCRSHAAALQAVFLTGSPSVVTPVNLAVATTERCVRCVVYAYAYQYVITTDGPVALSAEGRARLREIDNEAKAAVAQAIHPALVDARMEALAQELKQVVDTELRAAGHEVRDREERRERRSSDDADD